MGSARRFALALCLVVCAVAAPRPARGIAIGQSDAFATLGGWQRGALATPGLLGAPDTFLRLDAGGAGGTARLVTFDQTQWSGDYLAAGVARITLLAINLGAAPLTLRLALGDSSAPSGGGTWYATNAAVSLAPGSGWTPVSFDLGVADLVRTNGTASHAAVLGSVVALRILHASSPSALGDAVTGAVGLDAITAVPEPGRAALVAIALILLAFTRRSRS